MAATPPWLRRVLIESSTLTVSKGSFLTMALHPHVVRKAQEELDRILGNELLPGLLDWENLPYISVLLKELLRWTCPAQLGASNRVMEDDVNGGYHIPPVPALLKHLVSVDWVTKSRDRRLIPRADRSVTMRPLSLHPIPATQSDS